jgi:LysR family transcriptional regulator, glycine cleavage system transcriptional activator
MSQTHLRSFQALELALRTGSLRRAADALGITPAAVGQRIKTLEDYLGVELIVRGRSGIQPTPAAARATPHLERAFRELAAAAEALDFQRGDEIHVAANSDWAELWLAPRLPAFRRAHPHILFCVNGAGDVPMRLGRADVEIRFRGGNEGDVLFHDYLVPISSPANAARIAELPGPRLEGFPLLHLDFYRDDPEAIGWPQWIAAHRHRDSALDRGIRFQRIRPGLDAVSSDAGLMVCGLALVLDRVEAGEFTLPFPITAGAWTGHAFRARFRIDALRRPQVARFREWMLGEARTTAATLQVLTDPQTQPDPPLAERSAPFENSVPPTPPA